MHLKPTRSPFSDTGSQRMPPSNLAAATSSPRAVDPCDSGVDEAGLTTAVDIDVTPMQENIQENAWLALEALTDAHRVLPCAITATEGEHAWLPLRAEV